MRFRDKLPIRPKPRESKKSKRKRTMIKVVRKKSTHLDSYVEKLLITAMIRMTKTSISVWNRLLLKLVQLPQMRPKLRTPSLQSKSFLISLSSKPVSKVAKSRRVG